MRIEDNKDKTDTYMLVDYLMGDRTKFMHCYYTRDRIQYKIELKENETKLSVKGNKDHLVCVEHLDQDTGKLRFEGKGLCISDVHVVQL